MDRREKLLAGLDMARLEGAEIGPLTSPIVSRDQGRVLYVDHADTETLRRKYGPDGGVKTPDIVEVDAVWGDNTLAEALGPERRLDYVIASHVVEHTPDLVGWLAELAGVLAPGGSIRLAVPDRRFCFDYQRGETRLADVLAAHLAGARRPQPREIIDSTLHHRDVDLGDSWDGQPLRGTLDPGHLQHARERVDRALAGEYLDVHCWTFTLAGFAALMVQLIQLGLTDLACVRAFDTEVYENEFIVIMTPADAGDAAQSWRRIVEEAKVCASSEPQTWPQARQLWLERSRTVMVSGYERELEGLRRRLALTEREVADMRRSTSWRLTAPLRAAIQALRRRSGRDG